MPYRFFAPFALFLALLMSAITAQANLSQLFGNDNTSSGSAGFLPVEEAFQFNGRIVDHQALIDITITPEHYLYHHQFSFTPGADIESLGEPDFPEGEEIYDPYYQKNLKTFSADFTIRMPVRYSGSVPEISIKFQGCAKAGLCYPPKTISIPLILENTTGEPYETEETTRKVQLPETEESFYQNLLNQGLLLGLGLFLLAGIGLSFTPCVLPMFPILSSLILGNTSQSRGKTLSLTLVYIFSMSLTFAAAGTLTGLFGASLNIQAQLQSPWLLYPMAALFVVLALSMFGLYELQLPESLRSRLNSNNSGSGSIPGAATMGIFSALVVSPCVSAPLAGALIYISTTGDAIYGGLSLFVLGLGMGIPLLLVSLGGRQLLPKTGQWMNSVRALFGVMLLGVSIWMLERLIPASLTLLLWGILLIGSAVFLGALRLDNQATGDKLKQAGGITLLIYGACLITGAAMGNRNPLKPLNSGIASAAQTKISTANRIIKDSINLITVTTVTEMDALLAQSKAENRPAMVDFYADWCISCKVLERNVFPDPLVAGELSKLTLIKLDITENTSEHQQLMNQYNLFGPPALLFFDRHGKEVSSVRTLGDVSATQLRRRIDLLLSIR